MLVAAFNTTKRSGVLGVRVYLVRRRSIWSWDRWNACRWSCSPGRCLWAVSLSAGRAAETFRRIRSARSTPANSCVSAHWSCPATTTVSDTRHHLNDSPMLTVNVRRKCTDNRFGISQQVVYGYRLIRSKKVSGEGKKETYAEKQIFPLLYSSEFANIERFKFVLWLTILL